MEEIIIILSLSIFIIIIYFFNIFLDWFIINVIVLGTYIIYYLYFEFY